MGDVQLTPAFVFRYEKRMRAIQENEYARTLLAENNWWPKVAKTLPIDGASERLTWFLNTAQIRPAGDGGNIQFDPLVAQSTELVPQVYESAIRVQKDQLLDLRGGGLDTLADWSMQVGAATAGWFPQKILAELLMNGAATDGSAAAYDGVPFFADNTTSTTFAGVSLIGHPYNPYLPGLGGYVNWLHGSATTFVSGAATVTYPGALPIHAVGSGNVSVDTAFNNVAQAIAYAKSIKMPNGITPRYLAPIAMVVPPALIFRATEITQAKVIAQAAGASGGGGADVEAVIRRFGLQVPIQADELASSTSYTTQIKQAAQAAITQASGVTTIYKPTITGNDTTWYLIMRENMTSQLGGFIYVNRFPFQTNYFTGDTSTGPATGIDAILNRARQVEYICQGKVGMQYGHPYAVLRIDGS
jgi:hypothetical protein